MIYVQKIGKFDKFEELKEFVQLYCAQESIQANGGLLSIQGLESTAGPRNTAYKAYGGCFDGTNELDFTVLLEDFEDTIIEEMLKSIPRRLSRTRIFSLDNSEYSIHKDPSKRLHIPITTNKKCLFNFYNNDKELVHSEHLPADGSIYIVDTTNLHSTGNFEEMPRIHIVGSIIE